MNCGADKVKLVGPMRPNDFIADDFGLLEAYELRKRVGPAVAALQSVHESLDDLDR